MDVVLEARGSRQGLPPRPRGRRRRPRRPRRRAGRAARAERRGQDHHAADAARGGGARRRDRRDLWSAGRGRSQPRRGGGRLRGRVPPARRTAAGAGVPAALRQPLRHRRPRPTRSPRDSRASASSTWPTRWAPSCRRASARWSGSCGRRCTARACSCSTSRPRRSTPTSRGGCATGCADDLRRGRDTALLVTSHDMAEVERLCERVVFIAAGPDRGRRHAGGGRGAVRPLGPRRRVPPSGRGPAHRPPGAQQTEHLP